MCQGVQGVESFSGLVISIGWNLRIIRLDLHLHGPIRFLISIFYCGGKENHCFFRMQLRLEAGEHGMPFELFVRGRSLTL